MKKGLNNQITMADVAREAGVSIYTVSASLRGLATTAAKTRAYVTEVAERMGYCINSPASMLARQRKMVQRSHFLIGALGRSPSPTFFDCCERRGWIAKRYNVENVSDPRKVSNLMRNDGVDGIFVPGTGLVSPFWKNSARFDWQHFCAVKSSRALVHLPFHLVRHSAFDYQLKALDGVLARGYRRIGLILHKSTSEWDDRARLGATLVFQKEHHLLGKDCHCAILQEDEIAKNANYYKNLFAWSKRKKLDALVFFNWSTVVDLIERCGELPKNLGLAAVMADDVWNSTYPRVSGCNTNITAFYDCALDTLEKLIISGIRGFVKQPNEHVIEPTWIDGDTLPDKNS